MGNERMEGVWKASSFLKFMKKPVSFWLRLALGVIFIAASVDKILNPAAFGEIIHNYQILPDRFISVAAIVLPWLEIILGALLILGVWLPGAVFLTNLLLFAFFAALAFDAARGINVHCGCFSTSASGAASMTWYLFRDSLFLILSGSLFYSVFRKKRQAKEASRAQ